LLIIKVYIVNNRNKGCLNQQRVALVAIAVAIPLAMVATVYTGSAPQEPASSIANNNKTRVVTSFYPLYDFSSHVAGDRAEVSSLVPPGVEPHDWEPTLGDVNRARAADMLVINGAGFESWAEDIGAKRIVNTGEGIEPGNGGIDPHIWLDPVLAKEQVENIRSALAFVDPENASYYNENAAAYAAELDELDGHIRSELATCEKSDFISFHDSFGRFAERYGLRQHAIQGVTPEGEVLPQRIEEVITLARELGISVVYSEDLVDGRLAEVIASEIPSGRVMVLSPVEGVDKEELAAGIGYIEKMKENVASLKEGLQCSAQ
jgi:zinc transport system substrate-binding protein